MEETRNLEYQLRCHLQVEAGHAQEDLVLQGLTTTRSDGHWSEVISHFPSFHDRGSDGHQERSTISSISGPTRDVGGNLGFVNVAKLMPVGVKVLCDWSLIVWLSVFKVLCQKISWDPSPESFLNMYRPLRVPCLMTLIEATASALGAEWFGWAGSLAGHAAS